MREDGNEIAVQYGVHPTQIAQWKKQVMEEIPRIFSMKKVHEEVYLKDYKTVREAERGLRKYFEFYNNERLHQSLEYKTPATLYFQ